MTAPRNLEELAKIEDPVDRAVAAIAYEEQRMAAVATARAIRDAAILEVVAAVGVTPAARAVGMSVSHIKAIRSKR